MVWGIKQCSAQTELSTFLIRENHDAQVHYQEIWNLLFVILRHFHFPARSSRAACQAVLSRDEVDCVYVHQRLCSSYYIRFLATSTLTRGFLFFPTSLSCGLKLKLVHNGKTQTSRCCRTLLVKARTDWGRGGASQGGEGNQKLFIARYKKSISVLGICLGVECKHTTCGEKTWTQI